MGETGNVRKITQFIKTEIDWRLEIELNLYHKIVEDDIINRVTLGF